MKKIILIIVSLCLVLSVICFSGCKNKQKITTYDITCTLEDNILKGEETVSFYNDTENAFSELKFNLFANAFREDAKYSPISSQYKTRAYNGNVNYGDIKINYVESAQKVVPYTISGVDENILVVSLSEEVFPDETVSVKIGFTVNIANVIARLGVNSKTINLSNFYPILCGIENGGFYECVYYSNGDPFFSDIANYNVSLTCDSEYVVASSGKVVSSDENQNKRTTNYFIENARSFSFVLCKDYEFLSEQVGETTVNYYYYNDDNPRESLLTAVKAFKYFESLFGEYVYPTYSVCQTEFIQGGMEYTALTYVSDDLEKEAYNEVIVHETAHEWWQTIVGNNEVEYGFLDEGLAEYSVVLFYENHPEYNYDRQALVDSAEKTYKMFCSVYDKIYGKVDTTMLRSLDEYSSEYEYVNIAYIKPTIMYDTLRKNIGDENFFKGLQTYYKENSLKNANPDDLVTAFSRYNSMGESFFQSFFDGKVIL
ncbi:MAG: M1 family metallopeptidase [Clostridia bacterium]|nr:M1 family metallopeptidase [Clostridia bacterium]